MGNITELSQGNLDGLKKQVCECIDHAQAQGYKEGYEKGQNDADNDLKEIQNSTYDIAYHKALAEVTYFFLHADAGFIMECFPDESSFNLFELIEKYGLEVLIKKFKKWKEQQIQAEEEIKVGDIVINNHEKIKGVVYKVEDGFIYGTNGYLNSFEWDMNLCKRIEHIDEVSQLLDKLKGVDE